jgi:hypothetical protein
LLPGADAITKLHHKTQIMQSSQTQKEGITHLKEMMQVTD